MIQEGKASEQSTARLRETRTKGPLPGSRRAGPHPQAFSVGSSWAIARGHEKTGDPLEGAS